MFAAKRSRRELRDRLEDLVREAADIQNVVSLLRLRRAVGLQVDAYEPRIRTSRLEPIPLDNRRRASRLRV